MKVVEVKTEGIYRSVPHNQASPMFIAISLLPEGRGPGLPAFTPDHRYLLVPNELSDNISIISLEELAVIHTIPLQPGARPWQVKVIPSGCYAYVTNSRFAGRADASSREPSTVSFIDLRRGQVVQEISVGAGPNGVTVDRIGRRCFVVNMRSNDVTVIDVPSNRVVGAIPTGDSPAFGKLTHDGRILVVTNLGDSSVSIIDTETLQVLDKIKVGIPYLCDSYPQWGAGDTTGVAVSADDVAYLTNWRSHTIVVLDLHDRSVVKLDSPIRHPFGVEIDPIERVVVFTSGPDRKAAFLNMDNHQWLGVIPNDGTVFPTGRMASLNLWMTDPENHRLTALLPRGLSGSLDWDRNMVTKFM